MEGLLFPPAWLESGQEQTDRCRKLYCLWMGLCPSLSSCVTGSSGTGGAGINSDDSNS